jgi:hypothetical protein
LAVEGDTVSHGGQRLLLDAVDADLAAIGKSLSKMADNKKALADTLINLNIAVNTMVVAKNNETANLKVTAVNAVKSNNFTICVFNCAIRDSKDSGFFVLSSFFLASTGSKSIPVHKQCFLLVRVSTS